MPRSPDGAYPHVVAVNVNDDMLARIEKLAAQTGRSRAWLGREALARYLDAHDRGDDDVVARTRAGAV